MSLRTTIKKVLKEELDNKKGINDLDESTLITYQTLLNKILKKKYDWFKGIRLDKVGINEKVDYLYLKGVIFVDEDWGGNQWVEYNYTKPIPDSKEDLSFGDMISGGLSKEIQNKIKTIYSVISGEKLPRYTSFSWLDVELVHDGKINEQDDFLLSLMKQIMDTNKENKNETPTESKPLGIGVVGSGWKSCKAWNSKGGLSKWGDKIQMSKSSNNFTISYKGPSSGLSIAHAAGGGDTIHQLYNVLICEINPFLATTKAKPNIDNIQVSGGKEGGKSTLKISVPLESSDEHYQLDRRGGWNHDPGSSKMDEKCKKIKNSGGKCEGSVRNVASGPFGKITEYFITHTM